MQRNAKLYWQLFTSTFMLSAFTFGGGYVIVPLMRKKFVDGLHWLEEDEMLNITALAQSAPGVLAVNTSILLGYRIAGLLGAVVTMFGTVLPPLIIITIVSYFYNSFRNNAIISAVLKGMQAGIAAVIADVVVGMSMSVTSTQGNKMWILMIACFIAVLFFNVHIIAVILICGAGGALVPILRKRFAKGGKGA